MTPPAAAPAVDAAVAGSAAPAGRARPRWRAADRRLWRRVPVRSQLSEVDCGPACLAMVLSYHGRHTTVAEATRMTGTGGRDGTSLDAMARAAERCGLRAERADAAQLLARGTAGCLTPAVVHWQGRHFVVAERVTRRGVRLVDPAAGRVHVSAAAFAAGAGAALRFTPSPALVPVAGPLIGAGTLKVYRSVRQAVTARGGFAQLLAASLLLQLLGLALPAVTALVVDGAVPARSSHVLAAAAALAAGVAVATAVSALVRALVLARVHLRVDARVTGAFVEHLVRLPVPYLATRSPGDLVQRVAGTAALRDLVTNQLLTLCLDGPTALVYLAILAAASPWLAAATATAALVQVAVLSVGAGQLRELAASTLTTRAAEQTTLTETLRHLTGLKASGAERSAVERWRAAFGVQQRATAERAVVAAYVDAALTFGRTGAPFALLLVAIAQTLDGSASLGTALALSALAGAALGPASALAQSAQQLHLLAAAAERLADVLDTPAEQPTSSRSLRRPDALRGAIEVRGVTFRYPGSGRAVLSDVSLHVAPGERVAVVGASGSGKSTLLALVLGLYRPEAGQVLVDGTPVGEYDLAALRARFGVVTQDAWALTGSVRDNVALLAPAAGDAAVWRALRVAGLDADVAAWPMREHTRVGEHGAALSGGQRQRLALARAVLHDPVALLLDEATSHLDPRTEARVIANLASLCCTQLVVAHRLTTVRGADRIVVLDAGRIAESGAHADLLAAGGCYARLIGAGPPCAVPPGGGA